MKKLQLIVFALMAIMFLASCGGGNTQAEDTMKKVEAMTKEMKVTTSEEVEDISSYNSSSSKSIECDEFLKGYEDFMDKYIDIQKKYKADPTDRSIMNEYTTILNEASEWARKKPNCTDAEFIAKLSKIQLKILKDAGM